MIVIRVIDLYPWDAGTNSGMSYQAILASHWSTL